MKKAIILLLIINVLIINVYSNEKSKGSSKGNIIKGIEFSIGGGFAQGAICEGYTSIFYYEGERFSAESYPVPLVPLNMSLMLSLPISFVFFLNRKVGIGFVNNLGFSILFFFGYMPGEFEIVDKIGFVNKFGNRESGKFLLLEYYFTIVGKIFAFSIPSLITVDYSIPFSTATDIYIGPGLFIGFEKNFRKNKSFSIGGFSDIVFKYQKVILPEKFSFYYTSDKKEIIETIYMNLHFGVEFRFRYSLRKGLR